LRVKSFGEYVYTAYTNTNDKSKAYSKLMQIGRNFGQEWILREDSILSFHDLRDTPWSEICDKGSIERHSVGSWSDSTRQEHRREFVWLLNISLREKVKKDLLWDEKKKLYYFKPTVDLSPRKYNYRSLLKNTGRYVFQSYPNKKTGGIAYFRHSAFEGHFLKVGNEWFLEITPTYFFTRDGYRRDKFGKERLSGIKKLEHNNAVLGQVVMWASYLSEQLQGSFLDEKYPFMSFSKLEEFEINVGIDEESWLKNEDKEENEDNVNNLCDLPLFRVNYED
jgi:hypothetical protein